MKIYRTIVIVIAIILGILGTVLSFGPTVKEAINNPVNEEDYELLKENALRVAKTLDKNAITDETLTANYHLSGDELSVTVESNKAKIMAQIPISNYSFNVKGETILIKGTFDFKKIQYTKENKLLPAWTYIVLSIGLVASIAGTVYMLLLGSWSKLKTR